MGALDILKGLFLAFLAFLLIADLSTYVVFSSLKDNLMSASFYTGILERNGVYGKAQVMLIDSISGQQGLPEGITQEDVKAVLRQSVTVPWMKNQTEGLITNMITYLTTNATKPNLVISLKEVKTGLVSSLMNVTLSKLKPSTQQALNQSAIETAFNISVPGKCSGQDCIVYCLTNPSDCQDISIPSELQDFIGKCGSPDECITYCNNPANSADPGCAALMVLASSPEAQALIAAQIESQLSSQIPDSIDVYQEVFKDPQAKIMLANAKSYFKQASLALTALLVIAIVIAAVMVLVTGITNFKGICKVLGSPLLLAGIGLVVTALFIPGMAIKSIPAEVLKALGTANAAFVQNVVLDVLRTIFSSVTTQGLIIGGIGLVLVIASFFLKGGGEAKGKEEAKGKRKKDEEEEEEEDEE